MDKSTIRYIVRRLLISIVTLLVIVFVLFMMLKLMPGTPFNDEKLTEAQKAQIYAAYGLDKPVFTQFLTYVANMLKGDFGISYAIKRNMPVSALVTPRIGISFGLGIGVCIIGTILGLVLGIVAALNRLMMVVLLKLLRIPYPLDPLASSFQLSVHCR
ncbi:ABC transporter permease [Allobaculum sp. JKK-2023]|uniref:ABC transporter permease n=1 Tax=Allobaculum sp. JKK-2023 TaxID=3108943 RepID=UPI002B061BF1|nr:ABC transporter permease [Allobaculum sp. JKK-2023]